MKINRKDFLKQSAASSLLLTSPISFFEKTIPKVDSSKRMRFSFKPYTLELKYVFTVSTLSRTTTPVMLTEIEYDGIVGYGEASMPPYLGESHESATKFLSKVDLSKYENPFELETILSDIDSIEKGNPAAKASVDIALHDLIGKLLNQPWYNIYGVNVKNTPFTVFTIGIDKPEVVRKKMLESTDFKIIKIKLGKDNDKEMIDTVCSMTDKPITADPNQGWTDRNYAIDMINYLKEKGALYVEQPLSKDRFDDLAWLKENSPIPILADEGVQRLSDIPKAKNIYSGINIKLMKSTGMREAYKMILLAKSLGMKVMLGCMTETSCAISAASQLSPLVDWADLDGATLIKNDLFEGAKIINGKVTPSNLPGIGIKKLQKS
ncbi:MAG: dipeptide epimerase [Bacteroidetes bacterium]|nr:dipeptide epimerase [Bacteroidota bacterium]